LNHRKNGRQVVNPNNIPDITPPIKSEKPILGLKGTLFTRYHIAINKSVIAPKDPIATQ